MCFAEENEYLPAIPHIRVVVVIVENDRVKIGLNEVIKRRFNHVAEHSQ